MTGSDRADLIEPIWSSRSGRADLVEPIWSSRSGRADLVEQIVQWPPSAEGRHLRPTG
jgi:hypothetical protein